MSSLLYKVGRALIRISSDFNAPDEGEIARDCYIKYIEETRHKIKELLETEVRFNYTRSALVTLANKYGIESISDAIDSKTVDIVLESAIKDWKNFKDHIISQQKLINSLREQLQTQDIEYRNNLSALRDNLNEAYKEEIAHLCRIISDSGILS